MSYDNQKISDKIEWFEENLVVGAKIKIGKRYAEEYGYNEGEIITLITGFFEYDNGLYIQDISCPSIWCEGEKDFYSIYHLFGNHFECFLDCEIVN